MIEIKAYVGKDNNWPLQIPALDQEEATTFEESDTLFANVWEGQSQVAVFANTPVWFQEVTGLVVTNGGSGYSLTPTVTISGGGATTDATAYAIVEGGIITRFVITSGGDGYDGSTVTVVITDGTGTGATATATVLLGWQSGLVDFGVTAAESALLSPGGTYRFQIAATRGTLTSVVIDGLMQALATPGTEVPSPPDLCILDFAQSYCEVVGLTDAQRDLLPLLVTAASMAVRQYCQGRNFDLRTYSETCDVIQGIIRLSQPPIQIIQRIQGLQQLALTIRNTSASVQLAQAYFAYSGTWNGYGSNAQTPTGITLSSTSSGATTTATVDFTPSQTLSNLAMLINLVGSGWTATVESDYGEWPVSELDGGFIGQGCATNVPNGQGAQFNILQDIALSTCRPDPYRVGFVLVGNQGYSEAARWGPGGYEMWGPSYCYSRLKVTYVGGESVIPQQVQLAVAEMIKDELTYTNTDMTLKSETAQEYAYTFRDNMLGTMSDSIKQKLAPFIIRRA